MARAVTIQEFQDWLKKQKILANTWFHGSFNDDSDPEFSKIDTNISYKDKFHIAKYFDICLDTREMKIFAVTLRDFGKFSVRDYQDDNFETILDAIEDYMDKYVADCKKQRAERENKKKEEWVLTNNGYINKKDWDSLLELNNDQLITASNNYWLDDTPPKPEPNPFIKNKMSKRSRRRKR